MITVIIGKRTPLFEETLNKVVLVDGGMSEVERYNIGPEPVQSFFDKAQTASLFGVKKIFIISNLFENEANKKMFTDQIQSLASAPNDIVVLLESLLAPDVKKIEPFAAIKKVNEKVIKEQTFDVFSLANAFASGDRKKTWIMFQQALHHANEMEPVHGIIWWKLKDMMQKRNGYDEKVLKVLASKLISVYHESRLGGLGMSERLEEFFLTMPNLKK